MSDVRRRRRGCRAAPVASADVPVAQEVEEGEPLCAAAWVDIDAGPNATPSDDGIAVARPTRTGGRRNQKRPRQPDGGVVVSDLPRGAPVEVTDDDDDDDDDDDGVEEVEEERGSGGARSVGEVHDPCGSGGGVSPAPRANDSRPPAPPTDEELRALTDKMALLRGGGLHQHYRAAFAALQERAFDRCPSAFYTANLLTGQHDSAVRAAAAAIVSKSSAPPTEGEEEVESDVTCDDDDSGAGETAEAPGSPLQKRHDARAASSHSPPTSLDPRTTSLYRSGTTAAGRASLVWVDDPPITRESNHATRKEEGEEGGDDNDCSRKSSVDTFTSIGSPVAAGAGGAPKSFCDALRAAVQAVYDDEDAIFHDSWAEEQSLLQRRVEMLTGAPSTPEEEDSREAKKVKMEVRADDDDGRRRNGKGTKPSTARPSALPLQPVAPIDVFSEDLVSPCSPADATQEHNKSRLRLVFSGPKPATRAPPIAEGFHRSQVKTLELLQRRRAEARAAREQQQLIRRLHELPLLVEDAATYATLLCRLRSAHEAGHAPPPCGASGGLTSASASASAAVVQEAASSSPSTLPAGEGGQLLYLRYPPPLLRSTSFTAEVVRLLKWLRTWQRGSDEGDAATITATAAVAAAPAVVAAVVGGGGSSAVVKAAPDVATAAATTLAAGSRVLDECLEEAMRSGSSPDEKPRRASKRAVASRPAAATAAVKPEPKKSSLFLKFFGAAAVKQQPVKEEAVEGPTGHADEANAAVVEVPTTSPTAADARETRAENTEKTKGEGGEEPRRKAPRTEENMATTTNTTTTTTSPWPTASATTAETAGAVLASYREGWRQAARRSSSSAAPSSPALAVQPAAPAEPAPRIATRMPFYDDIMKETGALGSVAEVHCDRYGNRLRSARLAQKEAAAREREEAARRRRATKKGYFARMDDDEDRGGGGWGGGGGSPTDSNDGDDDDDDDDSGDDITNIAVISGPTGSGKTAAVYLAAHLLDFRVVEMNASVRRCPKSVERLLAELTRSHRLSGLHRGRGTISIEAELQRLKREHAALVEKAEAEAAEEAAAAAMRAKKAAKANAISAKAVAAFFSRKTASADTDDPSPAVEAQEAAAAAVVDVEESTTTDDVTKAETTTTTAAAAGAGRPPRTLLLVEDADVLLGDEAMRPFYAAIRDLAQCSNTPLAVTVSSPAADPSSRYSPAASAMGRSGDGHGDRMAAMAAEVQQLLEEEAIPEGNAFQHIAMNAALAAQYLGRRTPLTRVERLSRAALYVQLLVVAAVELGLVAASPRASPPPPPPVGPHTGAGGGEDEVLHGDGAYCQSRITHGTDNAPLINVGVGGNGSGSGSGSGGGSSSSCRRGHSVSSSNSNGSCGNSSSSNKKKKRPRRGAQKGEKSSKQALDLRVDARGRGTWKPYRVLDDGSQSCSNTTPSLASNSCAGANDCSSGGITASTGSHSADTTSTTTAAAAAAGAQTFTPKVLDEEKFQRLAAVLRQELFPNCNAGGRRGRSLEAMAAARAGELVTTDIRLWMNRLQYLLLDKESLLREDRCGTPPPPRPWQSCEEVSAADTAYGRFLACVAANDLRCPRQQRWQWEGALCHGNAVADELDTMDVPLLCNFAHSGRAPASSTKEAAVDVDTESSDDEGEGEGKGGGGRRGSGGASKKKKKGGKGKAPPKRKGVVQDGGKAQSGGRGRRAQPHQAEEEVEVEVEEQQPAPLRPQSPHQHPATSPKGTIASFFHWEAKASSADGAAPPSPRAPATAAHLPWERQWCGVDSWRMPTDLVLPYGETLRWMRSLDAHSQRVFGGGGLVSADAATPAALPPALPPPPVPRTVRGLPPHQSPATAPSVSAAGGGGGSSSGSHHTAAATTSSGGGGGSHTALPGVAGLSRVAADPAPCWSPPTTDRLALFKAAWRRTRKTDALKQFVVARGPGVAADVLGFPCLLAPSAPGVAAHHHSVTML